jgi:hypothetical protein
MLSGLQLQRKQLTRILANAIKPPVRLQYIAVAALCDYDI